MLHSLTFKIIEIWLVLKGDNNNFQLKIIGNNKNDIIEIPFLFLFYESINVELELFNKY